MRLELSISSLFAFTPYYLTRSVPNNGHARKETLFTKSFRILGRLQEPPFSPFATKELSQAVICVPMKKAGKGNTLDEAYQMRFIWNASRSSPSGAVFDPKDLDGFTAMSLSFP